jgi:uncharacterized protein
MEARACTQCGACCMAPDILALDKPLGRRCTHLGDDNRCRIYETRPWVCRSYAADALCDAIDAPTLDERVANYLSIFGLTEEAHLKQGSLHMRKRRHLPLL